jgi:hypothetical protein
LPEDFEVLMGIIVFILQSQRDVLSEFTFCCVTTATAPMDGGFAALERVRGSSVFGLALKRLVHRNW